MDLQNQMKQIVADAAIKDVEDGMIIGLGSGSTAALMIKSLAKQIRLGKLKNIRGVPTSFQSEVLALELNIPLIDLASVNQIDMAIDGADEVDPGFQLIKGGGACHVREKLVASKANKLLIVVDQTKLVQNLNQVFPLPVEVIPSAWKQVKDIISEIISLTCFHAEGRTSTGRGKTLFKFCTSFVSSTTINNLFALDATNFSRT